MEDFRGLLYRGCWVNVVLMQTGVRRKEKGLAHLVKAPLEPLSLVRMSDTLMIKDETTSCVAFLIIYSACKSGIMKPE